MGFIYKITNIQTDMSYVGKTIKNIDERFNEHVSNGRNIRGNSLIAKSLREYGTINHKIEILEECDNSILLQREQYWIDELNTLYLGYNVKNEYLEKNKQYWGNKKKAEENKILGQIWNKGISPNESVRKKISLTKKKKYNLGLYDNSYGHKHTEETKIKLSKIAKNRPPPSEETRKKIGEQSSGRAFYYSIIKKNRIFISPDKGVPDGYVRGKGQIWMNKDGKSVTVDIWDKEKYIIDNYEVGR